MATQQVYSDMNVNGQLTATTLTPSASTITNAHCSSNMGLARSKLAQDTLACYPVPWTAFRVWDAYETSLPGTSSNDDLGLYGGTFASASPAIETYDVKGAGLKTFYARFMVSLPPEYDAAETVQIRLHAGMLTNEADASATVDIQCYESDKEAGISADLCTTAATTCNSLTLADIDFTITSTNLVAGDVLDVRIAMAITDAATGTAVQGIIGSVELLCDIRG